ncbi:neural cell adhesion molecule L1-like protein isoform X1 [Neopelma chrysocephalum]|uniref:neural cell adhesion molecule L1-like protein isoform X1 n=1 Tax=Neopelma chrysocephalum TaxID=114329 RepID=UPI000FCD4AEE|nr:neural cell adhesion molecule L1-like protein isoform X1 [Neopelma chrysocephalum]XP_027556228.1 neural cell adhesion molecule L1-like protein isoform X1 [Neopelma chrysocephalum]XP_027556230.1 neural cell adhesion molecule L1-like protein isoform X1 [Neopelma chrysocephalum]XP_027556231.1 neural cell adhesion molecule L1-like protein isoform X1 [Neopelma chrysocephalum]XP_027556232.1 neural cell adhesion molecule L1-like protein isoform X1 [Neopelma chrysocephalum]
MEMLLSTKGITICLFFFVLSLAAAIEIPLSVSQLPTITEQSHTQVAYPFDEDFTIKCEARGNPHPTFNWTKDGKPFDLSSDPRIVTSNNSGTFVIQNRGIINNFQGKYRCFASNVLGTAMSEEIELIVPSVPKFPKEKIEPLDVEHGDSVILHCNPPKGIPPLHIYWMNIDLQHIPQDERVSMSLKGDLYFANVEENDSRSDYCCFAAFPRLRTIVQKMPMTLKVSRLKHANDSGSPNAAVTKANFIKERKPKLLIPPESAGSSSSVTVIKGGVLLLECIAEGLPTPHLSWVKVTGNMPKDEPETENFGKILKIDQVSAADEGTYQCTASNPMGRARHEFHVHVEEPPQWLKKPEGGVYSVGTNLVLLCEAIGNPEPSIQWKLNGMPIDSRTFRGRISTREISLTNLQLQDSAVFQCEATNKHGTILASANVNVLNIAPLILTSDGENYATVVGYSAFLHCDIFASPAADVRWTKDDSIEPLSTFRYELNKNGTLEIKDTKKEDSGSYACWAANSVGKRAITANLDIRDATKLVVTPKNPRVLKSHSILLKCQAEYDSHLKHSFKLSWRKDGDELPVNSTEGGRMILDRDTLFISSVLLEDQGVYTCVGSTSLDSATAEAQLIVLDVPDPPEDLQLSENQNRSVRLSWRAGSNHNSPVNESIIEFEENRWEPGRWQELTRIPGDDTTALLSLAPYVNYQFRVVSVNAVGRSQPSKPSLRYSTPPAAPDKNPENIRVEASEPNEMVMKWEPLKPVERNGPGLEYKVSWRQRGVRTDWNEETVKKHSLTVRNTPTFVPYEIKVQAVNNLGSGPEPNVTIGYSGEDFPDAAPSGVSVDVVNSTLVKVFWFGIPRDRVRGHLRGYKVSWWKTKNMLDGKRHHPEKHFLTFVGDRNYGMIPGLDPFSEFHLTVLAYNSRGDGPESSPVVFETPEGVPEQPRFLRILNFDEDSVTLSWGLPRKANGHLTGYILQYQIINETHEVGPVSDVSVTNRSTLSWRLSGLSPSTKYKFYVKACTAQGCGKPVTEEGLTMAQGSKGTGRISDAVKPTQKFHPIEALEPGTEYTVRLVTKNWVDNNSIFEDVIETRGRVPQAYAGIYDGISTQGWFIGLMCAIALLTLLLLTICFVRRNKGGKYSVKEKEDLHPDPEAQSIKDEIFGEYSDSDEKPLKGSLQSLNGDIKATESADSLVDYGEGEHGMFNEDGSFIGAYSGSKEKGSVESTGSSTATFPLHA